MQKQQQQYQIRKKQIGLVHYFFHFTSKQKHSSKKTNNQM